MTDMSNLELTDGIYDADVSWRGMVCGGGALIAANFPVKPPTEWFTDPGLKALTPLTVENGGRVYGHVAAWHTSHIGLAGGVKPPKSKSNYAFFRTGVVETHDGQMVPVGQITLTGGHAPLDVTVAHAVAHYDNTNSAIMDVAAGEDKHGIWVAGSLRPSVTDEQIRAIRASSVSGDWRPINGRLELVAICAVNCPGFPIPRARVAAGAPIALVAAGVEPLIEATIRRQVDADVEAGIAAGLEIFRERVTHLERAMLAAAVDDKEFTADMAPEIDVNELRRRVKGEKPEYDDEIVASLRSRVKAPITASLRDRVKAPLADALRDRVHGGAPAVPFPPQ